MVGLGMTETSPYCLFTTALITHSDYVGTPTPKCKLKLMPMGDRLEAHFHGPHVIRDYWCLGGKPAALIFGEDGYYCSGNALRFCDPKHPEKGLVLDGRIAEDFKFNSGIFISVGSLCTRVIAVGAPYMQDVVIVGMSRDDIGLLMFPQMERCHSLSGPPTSASVAQVLVAPAVRVAFAALPHELNATVTGSTTRVARLLLLGTPPSLDRGEITDKGTFNQHVVLAHRAEYVGTLYRDGDPAVIHAS